MQRIIRLVQQAFHIGINVTSRFREDRGFRVASALSFTTLLALVPLLTVIFSMFSLFPVFENWTGQLETYVFQHFVPAAGETVKGYLFSFSENAGKLTAVGLLFLMISSLLLLATIEDTFNDIWRVTRGRNMVQRLLVYWAVLTLGPILIAVSLSMSSALLSLSLIADQTVIAEATQNILSLLPLLLELVSYLVCYMAIPNTTVKFRHALVGAITATIFFELSKIGFAYYIVNFKSYQLIYGALATIPIFFLWVYLSWIVMLVGAQVTAVLKATEKADIDQPGDKKIN